MSALKFIGHVKLEGVFKSTLTFECVRDNGPAKLYVLRYDFPVATDPIMGQSETRIVVQGIEGDNVHYWFTRQGFYMTDEGRCHAADLEKYRRITERARAFQAGIGELLESWGAKVTSDATVAMPYGVVLLEGEIEPFTYDKTSDRYHLQTAALGPHPVPE